ncbi:hypothetical protein L2U69_13085 [Zavarzinia compransoris]|uniref:hypothetical protein n=1 Tax=Zavarzinia marina TaxID=2911065 RepID=UPI001F2E6FC2|nr:hypothetical protein [Zavarzinia marina]MCF4166581.1 hypothetical protein [Zavarzinia marina]
MRRFVLLIAAAGLGACAELSELQFETAGVRDVAAPKTLKPLAPPAVLHAETAPNTVVETGPRRRLGQAPGLFGDRVETPVTPEAPRMAALDALKSTGEQAGIHVFASTVAAASASARLVVDLPAGPRPADELVADICVDAGFFCFYAGELAALSVYDLSEFRAGAKPLRTAQTLAE